MNFSSRREFLKYCSLSFILFLNSCSNASKEVTLALQSYLYPESFKDVIPKNWKQKRFSFVNSNGNKSFIYKSDFTLINDGWIDSINFSEFDRFNESYFLEILDKRSKNFLNNFAENQKNILFPIGVTPYAVIIKNNKDLIRWAEQSWDFLLSKNLTNKIVFPRSPRIVKSIAERISSSKPLAEIKKQAMLFDDQNTLNWLIKSDACAAIVPYSLCSKYLKIDSSLSVVFPEQGVPLMWHFILSRSKINNQLLIEWIKSLESKSIVDNLATQGWYLPFSNDNAQSKYRYEISKYSGPSQNSWENSWSFPPLTISEKIIFENAWNKDLIP